MKVYLLQHSYEYEIDRDHWTEGFITWNGEKDEWIE
ncbi:hypothetical protein IGI67_004085 [Enterococcus sp. AZ196]